MIVASQRDRFFSFLLALGMGILLAFGFLPSVHSLYSQFFPPHRLKEMATFLAFAALFGLSIPNQTKETNWKALPHLLRISLLPICTAYVFGLFFRSGLNWSLKTHLEDTLWYVLFIPIGEEFLFRGWFFGIFERVWKETMLTATNPLPLSVWGSALGFSIWHIQNVGVDTNAFVLFQVVYTFLTGIWLGYLRLKSGKIWPGIFAHFLINLVSGLSNPFMLK